MKITIFNISSAMARVICGLAMLSLFGCSKTNSQEDATNLGSDVLKAMEVTAGGEQVIGEIDQESHTVYLRHIHSGENITSASVTLNEGYQIVTDLNAHYGNWPENLEIELTDGNSTSKYTINLCDYIKSNDYYLPDSGKWKLVWNEEFKAPTIDWNNWSYCSRSSKVDWNRYMSEEESLTYIENGNLVLKAIENTIAPDDTASFLTGGLTGTDKRYYKLGRVDIRAKYTHAQGFWPAIWMMPQTSVAWPNAGEIDICEHINHENTVHQTVHSSYTKTVSKTDPVSSADTPHDNILGYILYSVEIDEDCVIFRLDGQETLRYKKDPTKNGQFPFDQYAYYMILSAQLGGSWPGAPDPAELPASMTVDFVRFYVAADSPEPEPDPDPDPNPDPGQDAGEDNSIEDPIYHLYN